MLYRQLKQSISLAVGSPSSISLRGIFLDYSSPAETKILEAYFYAFTSITRTSVMAKEFPLCGRETHVIDYLISGQLLSYCDR